MQVFRGQDSRLKQCILNMSVLDAFKFLVIITTRKSIKFLCEI